jgi:uncharacterized protein (TIGR00251 family)
MSDELVPVHVKPRSSRAGVEIDGAGGIVVRVHAPAAEGAANQECVRVLADALGVPKSAVTIARGGKSRAKQIQVSGLCAEEVMARLRGAAT